VTRKVGIINWGRFLVLDLSSSAQPGRRRFRRQRRYRRALPRKVEHLVASGAAPSIDLLEEVSLERACGVRR
jgi:hypothetical protein